MKKKDLKYSIIECIVGSVQSVQIAKSWTKLNY